MVGCTRQWKMYVPGPAVTFTVKLVIGGPSGAPLLTMPLPSNTHGSTTVPQVRVWPAGKRPGRLNSECVVPFGFRVVSSVSGAATPAAALSWATVVAGGRIVAVWNPSIANATDDPVATVAVRGK